MQIDSFSLIIILFVAGSFLLTFIKIIRVKLTGVEADAVVTRLEEHDVSDADGIPREYYDVYVRYQTKEGNTVTASLANSDDSLCVGDWVRIKYIPGKDNYPVLEG